MQTSLFTSICNHTEIYFNIKHKTQSYQFTSIASNMFYTPDLGVFYWQSKMSLSSMIIIILLCMVHWCNYVASRCIQSFFANQSPTKTEGKGKASKVQNKYIRLLIVALWQTISKYR